MVKLGRDCEDVRVSVTRARMRRMPVLAAENRPRNVARKQRAGWEREYRFRIEVLASSVRLANFDGDRSV
jgi:hypothetical protein